MPETKTKQLAVKNVTADPECQSRRDGLDEATVKEYAEAKAAGVEFPAVVVYHDAAGTNWLSEGFHRFEADRRNGAKHVEVEMRSGTREDAILNSVGSNAAHGLKRSNADKRFSVEKVLKLKADWTDRRIADAVGVSHPFVASVRGELETVSSSTRVGKDGKKRAASKSKSGQVQNSCTSTASSDATKNQQPTQPEGVASSGGESESAGDSAAQVSNDGGAAGSGDATAEPEGDPAKAFVARVETLCRDVDQVVSRMKGLKADRYAYSMHVDSAVSQVEAARKTLWQGRPAFPCPYCEANEADGCRACNGTKRVKKSTRESGVEAVGGVW
jgi:hypothetical protein